MISTVDKILRYGILMVTLALIVYVVYKRLAIGLELFNDPNEINSWIKQWIPFRSALYLILLLDLPFLFFAIKGKQLKKPGKSIFGWFMLGMLITLYIAVAGIIFDLILIFNTILK